ncbi:MAG: hypothetical protein N3G22_04525 [Candidatus Micrarchaeota archaeon]|nr:hypothetical protein [Candidatus Micrarchaeota archaeon]
MPIQKIISKKAEFISKQSTALLSKIKIKTDQGSYSPGSRVLATIELHLKKPIEARSLEARLFCTQTRRTKAMREMDTYDYRMERELGVPRTTHLAATTSVSEKVVHSERKIVSGQKKYESGAFEVEFQLPPSAQPTSHSFSHDSKKVVWKIEARLDVPLAPDIVAAKEIIVEAQ